MSKPTIKVIDGKKIEVTIAPNEIMGFMSTDKDKVLKHAFTDREGVRWIWSIPDQDFIIQHP